MQLSKANERKDKRRLQLIKLDYETKNRMWIMEYNEFLDLVLNEHPYVQLCITMNWLIL